MQLNPSEISELIKKRLENFDTKVEARTEGTIVSVTDGIVRIHGLSDVMHGEMLEFPGDVLRPCYEPGKRFSRCRHHGGL